MGCCAASCGLGLLIGHCFESGLLTICVGVGLIFLGLSVLKRK